jgi:hypothetical protein
MQSLPRWKAKPRVPICFGREVPSMVRFFSGDSGPLPYITPNCIPVAQAQGGTITISEPLSIHSGYECRPAGRQI